MNSKVQQLTDTIYNEGVQKAREEAEVILKEAREKASAIEEKAQKDADRIVKKAEENAQETKKQVDSEIKMTLNQAVSAMKQEVTSLITLKVVQPPVKELFSNKEYLKELISTIVKGWMEKDQLDVEVILPEQDKDEMESYFKNNLAKELNNELEVKFSKNVKSGFKIGPAGESYLISFTDEDFTNFLKGYLRPKTTKLLFEEEKK